MRGDAAEFAQVAPLIQLSLRRRVFPIQWVALTPTKQGSSRLRRAGVGYHHHIAGLCLARYAQESAWREGHRRDDNGSQAKGVVRLALVAKPSVDLCGYWQLAAA